MKTPVINLFLLICLLTAGIRPCVAVQQNPREQLEAIRERIENTEIDLAQKEQAEARLLRELALLKRTLQRIDANIQDLRRKQEKQDRLIGQQQQKIDAGKKGIRAVGKRIETRLVALYKDGEIGPLRVIFSADSPTELVQQYQYLTRILSYDRELLSEYRSVLQAQEERLTQLEDLKKQQEDLLEAERQQRKDAQSGRELQTQLLTQVRSDRKRLNRELAGLQEKAGRLQQLIEKLKKRPRPAPVPGGVEFSAGPGSLEWPVDGEVIIGFGTQADAQLGTLYESNGVEISVKTGQSVKAVANGRVVFADWFKGYGNLMILSHAGGYHTLYAQLADLKKSLGDQVKAGELLGYTGLDGRESIYFEIRHAGTAVDPLKWLRGR